jgi:hypothetical protein
LIEPSRFLTEAVERTDAMKPYQVAQLDWPRSATDVDGRGGQSSAERLTQAAQEAFDHYPNDSRISDV